MQNITHIAIGMGLGLDEWSLASLQACAALQKPMLIDADALNLIAENNISLSGPLIITPHPGEAARLLSFDETITSADIQKNRFAAVRRLHALFVDSESCVVILKGAGTLIYNGNDIKACNLGSAAMAAPGMGDVLSGIVSALWAQQLLMDDVAELAVCLHAAAAEKAAQGRTRGLLASDVVRNLLSVMQ